MYLWSLWFRIAYTTNYTRNDYKVLENKRKKNCVFVGCRSIILRAFLYQCSIGFSSLNAYFIHKQWLIKHNCAVLKMIFKLFRRQNSSIDLSKYIFLSNYKQSYKQFLLKVQNTSEFKWKIRWIYMHIYIIRQIRKTTVYFFRKSIWSIKI